MSVYFDASILVSLFIDDDSNEKAEAYLRDASPTVCLSDFAAAEFSSALNRRVRMGLLPAREARAAFGEFDVWRTRGVILMGTTAADIATADSYLRRLDLPLRTPDALHIAIADRAAAPLATFDKKMAECAKTLGVAVAPI
ncbi:MAG: type II toxin-antitoxin system VapC family toxin [Caulobacteraceae bacterium]